MASMSTQSDEFQKDERVVHPIQGEGTIYQDQAGWENAMVVFDSSPSVVVGVRPRELSRIRSY